MVQKIIEIEPQISPVHQPINGKALKHSHRWEYRWNVDVLNAIDLKF